MDPDNNLIPIQPNDGAPQTLRSILEIIADLSQTIHPFHIKTKKKGGATLSFISWYTAVELLDLYAPGWSSEVRSVSSIGSQCVCVVRIWIPCLEGMVWREATGIEDEEHDGYGDASSNAEAMAFKRAAAKFGLGLYLYKKETERRPQPNAERSNTRQPTKTTSAAPKAAAQTQSDTAVKEKVELSLDDRLRKGFADLKLTTGEQQKKAVEAALKLKAGQGKAVAKLADDEKLKLLEYLRGLYTKSTQGKQKQGTASPAS